MWTISSEKLMPLFDNPPSTLQVKIECGEGRLEKRQSPMFYPDDPTKASTRSSLAPFVVPRVYVHAPHRFYANPGIPRHPPCPKCGWTAVEEGKASTILVYMCEKQEVEGRSNKRKQPHGHNVELRFRYGNLHVRVLFPPPSIGDQQGIDRRPTSGLCLRNIFLLPPAAKTFLKTAVSDFASWELLKAKDYLAFQEQLRTGSHEAQDVPAAKTAAPLPPLPPSFPGDSGKGPATAAPLAVGFSRRSCPVSRRVLAGHVPQRFSC